MRPTNEGPEVVAGPGLPGSRPSGMPDAPPPVSQTISPVPGGVARVSPPVPGPAVIPEDVRAAIKHVLREHGPAMEYLRGR